MQENDRLQGILFNAQDTIRFADASTVSKRMMIKTRKVTKRVGEIKNHYHLPLPDLRIHSNAMRQGAPKRLRANQTADVAIRLKVQ